MDFLELSKKRFTAKKSETDSATNIWKQSWIKKLRTEDF